MKYIYIALLFFSCSEKNSNANNEEDKSDTLNNYCANKLIVSENQIELKGNYQLKIKKENDSIWNGYYFDYEKAFVKFYKYGENQFLSFNKCYQSCFDIIVFDSLFNPIIKYRFENKTSNGYNDKKLVYLSYYNLGDEVIIKTIKRNYFLNWSFNKQQIMTVTRVVIENEIPIELCSNPGFLKNNTKYWMKTVDDCFGWMINPNGMTSVRNVPNGTFKKN